MKRGYLIGLTIILAILMLPIAMAEISFDTLTQNEFNIGDSIKFSGSIESENTIEGFLILNINCEGNSKPLQLPIPVTLYANEEKKFPNQISMPEIEVKESMLGSCNIELQLKNEDEVLEQGNSETFRITKNLRGSFSIEQTLIQVGKEVSVSGIVQRMDGTPINGEAEVFFNDGKMSYPVPPTLEVVDGIFNFKDTINAIPAGEYTVEVIITDSYGNQQLFNAAKFTLTNQLTIVVDTNQYEYVPGQEVEIKAEVRNIMHEPVDLASAYVILNNQEFSAQTTNQEVSQTIILPKDIKSGKHTLTIKVKDALGNKGSINKDIFITPIATTLKNEFIVKSYKPSESVIMNIAVYDQASDLISDYVNIEIYDAKDNLVSTIKVLSGTSFEFFFPKYALPGEWTIKTQYWDLKQEEIFSVEVVKNFVASITGQVVTIVNEGNVRNEDPIKLNLQGEEGEFSVLSKEKIKPGESVNIDLNKNAPSGIYTLAISDTEGEEAFDSVVITDGKAVKNLNAIFSVLVFLLIGMIVFMTITMKKKKMTPKLSTGELKHLAKAKATEFSKRKNVDKEKNDAIEDYKKIALAEIKRTEDANKRKMFMPKRETTWIRPKPRVEEPKEEKKDEPMNGAAGFFGGF